MNRRNNNNLRDTTTSKSKERQINTSKNITRDDTNITIGPIKYTIVLVPNLRSDNDGKRLWGEVKEGRCEIHIKADSHPVQRRQTLWHEVVHIVLAQAGRGEDSDRESLIGALAYGLMTVIQAHPWLAEKPEGEQERARQDMGE